MSPEPAPVGLGILSSGKYEGSFACDLSTEDLFESHVQANHTTRYAIRGEKIRRAIIRRKLFSERRDYA